MYRFKKEYADAFIILPGTGEEIHANNLTDEKAEMILKKFPQFAHNIESFVPAYEEKEKRKRRTKEEIEADKAKGIIESDEDVDE